MEAWLSFNYDSPQKPFHLTFYESGPADMLEPRRKGMRMVVYVDCDLGGDLVTRRSRTGFAVFFSIALQSIG